MVSCPMFILAQKLRNLKQELKNWNKEGFGDVHQMVKEAQANLDLVQAQLSADGSSANLMEVEKTAQIELHKALHFQEEFGREKSRINWHKHGDRNTAIFHKVTKIRNASQLMSILKVGDEILAKQEDIEHHVLQFYESLFATENNCIANELIDSSISSLVSAEDNFMLTNLPSKEEVKQAVFSMDSSGAPGLDGFGGVFYQKFWHIIENDVYNSVV